MFLLVAILVLQPASLSPIETTNGLVQRINYGVIFKEEPNIILAQEYWMNTLPFRFRRGLPYQNLKNAHNLHVQALTHYNETMKSIQVLLPNVDLNPVQCRR